jgi:DNA-binding GntR family transcriptional regulator
LIIKQTTYDNQDVAIEYSLSLLREDRYTATVVSCHRAAQSGGKTARE